MEIPLKILLTLLLGLSLHSAGTVCPAGCDLNVVSQLPTSGNRRPAPWSALSFSFPSFVHFAEAARSRSGGKIFTLCFLGPGRRCPVVGRFLARRLANYSMANIDSRCITSNGSAGRDARAGRGHLTRVLSRDGKDVEPPPPAVFAALHQRLRIRARRIFEDSPHISIPSSMRELSCDIVVGPGYATLTSISLVQDNLPNIFSRAASQNLVVDFSSIAQSLFERDENPTYFSVTPAYYSGAVTEVLAHFGWFNIALVQTIAAIPISMPRDFVIVDYKDLQSSVIGSDSQYDITMEFVREIMLKSRARVIVIFVPQVDSQLLDVLSNHIVGLNEQHNLAKERIIVFLALVDICASLRVPGSFCLSLSIDHRRLLSYVGDYFCDSSFIPYLNLAQYPTFVETSAPIMVDTNDALCVDATLAALRYLYRRQFLPDNTKESITESFLLKDIDDGNYKPPNIKPIIGDTMYTSQQEGHREGARAQLYNVAADGSQRVVATVCISATTQEGCYQPLVKDDEITYSAMAYASPPSQFVEIDDPRTSQHVNVETALTGVGLFVVLFIGCQVLMVRRLCIKTSRSPILAGETQLDFPERMFIYVDIPYYSKLVEKFPSFAAGLASRVFSTIQLIIEREVPDITFLKLVENRTMLFTTHNCNSGIIFSAKLHMALHLQRWDDIMPGSSELLPTFYQGLRGCEQAIGTGYALTSEQLKLLTEKLEKQSGQEPPGSGPEEGKTFPGKRAEEEYSVASSHGAAGSLTEEEDDARLSSTLLRHQGVRVRIGMAFGSFERTSATDGTHRGQLSRYGGIIDAYHSSALGGGGRPILGEDGGTGGDYFGEALTIAHALMCAAEPCRTLLVLAGVNDGDRISFDRGQLHDIDLNFIGPYYIIGVQLPHNVVEIIPNFMKDHYKYPSLSPSQNYLRELEGSIKL